MRSARRASRILMSAAMDLDRLTPYEYYCRHFPFAALELLSTIHGDPLCNREFAIEGAYYKRYVEAKSERALRAAVLEMTSLKSIHIGPVCTERVSLVRRGLATPVRKEFVVDIDLTDYDFLSLTTRDDEGNEVVDLEACDAAWPFAAIGIFLLRWMLREQFGYERFMVVYSGRRGAHLWVLDERAMSATDEVRASVASSVNLELTKGNTRATSRMLAFVDTYQLWDVVEHAFVDLVVEGDHFDNYGNLESFVDRLDLKHDGARNLGEDACNAGTPSEAWACIQRVVASIAKQLKQEWVADRLRETMLAYVWPRIDFNVSKATNHLIKCPYVAHPKTGRIAVPIDPDDYWRFDPRKAPSLANLGPDWEGQTDLARWIRRDKPQLPDLSEHFRPRPRRARRPNAAPNAAPIPPTEVTDVEDLAGAAAPRARIRARSPSPIKAVPRPRAAAFVRKVSPLAVAAAVATAPTGGAHHHHHHSLTLQNQSPSDAREYTPLVTSDSD